MQLRALVDQIPVVSVNGTLDREITGITHDSRRITPGMVFVALTGQRADGIEFIGNAIERGAAAVICDRQGAAPARTAYIKVADARAALARASAAYYEWPATKLKVIGITGTNGKTTVSFLVKHLLEAAGIATGLIGTVRYEIGERIIPAQRTTPEAPDLQLMMAQMVRAGCRACVMEVSSHALEQKRVGGIEFDVAIFTNLTQDHLDYHPTMEAYFTAKQQLFGMLRRSSGREAAVINIDDVYGSRLAQEAQAGVLLSYGINETALIHATDIRLGREDTEMRVHLPGGGFACRMPLIGRHNVYNALAAVGAGVALEIDASLIRSALHMARPVPGRLEAVAEGQPFGIFVDYAHTPDALENVLRTVREICSGRLLLTFGCGGSRDPGKRPLMGEVAARLADFTIITSDNPRRESPADIAREIAAGFARVREDGFTVELDRRRGIELALQMAQPHDCVLIAGKGHETYQEFDDTVVPFDDRLCAVEVLDTLGYHA